MSLNDTFIIVVQSFSFPGFNKISNTSLPIKEDKVILRSEYFTSKGEGYNYNHLIYLMYPTGYRPSVSCQSDILSGNLCSFSPWHQINALCPILSPWRPSCHEYLPSVR